MAHDVNEAAITARYGGSDNTSPSFNRARYVRFGAAGEPAELGVLDSESLIVSGLIGAESGTQTLFFRFHLPEPARIGIDLGVGNIYIDQYIALSLKAPTGRWIPPEDVRLLQPVVAQQQFSVDFTPPDGPGDPASEAYVDPGYWVFGYAELDGDILIPPSFIPLLGASTNAVPASEPLPEGEYLIAVSSSQWPQLPFRFQLATRGNPHLHGAVDLALEPIGRLSLVKIGGSADVRLEPRSRIRQFVNLSGSAETLIEPRLTLRRVSPFV